MILFWFALNGCVAWLVYTDCQVRYGHSGKAMLWALPVFVLGATTVFLGVAVILLYFVVSSIRAPSASRQAPFQNREHNVIYLQSPAGDRQGTMGTMGTAGTMDN